MNGRAITRKFLTVSTFLSVLAAMGCGTYSPVSPSQDDTPGVETPTFVQVITTSTGSSGKEDVIQASSSSVSMVISAETGGTVSNGIISLYFPPGALDEDTEITIDMPMYPQAMVELGPHGIEFNKAVIMTLPLSMIDSDADSYTTLYNNENIGIWEDIGGYIENDNVVSELEHFSEYGYLGKG